LCAYNAILELRDVLGVFNLKRFNKTIVVLILLIAIIITGCVNRREDVSVEDDWVIGLSMDTLKEERWQKDRDIFVAEAEELGAKVYVQAANGSDERQMEQCLKLMDLGIDVLVIIPHSSTFSEEIVKVAHERNIPVIAYDRLVEGDVDYYISFDNHYVGVLQANYLTETLGIKRGNIVYIGGFEEDYNALQYRDGVMQVLDLYPDINVIYDEFTVDWLPSDAKIHMEKALNKSRFIKAVICANDGMAGGAVDALAEQQRSLPLIGQDAEIAACQRIVEGKQVMTVYKDIRLLAKEAARLALKIAKGETIHANASVSNSTKEIPSTLLSPVSVDVENMLDVIINSGFHSYRDVYRNVN